MTLNGMPRSPALIAAALASAMAAYAIGRLIVDDMAHERLRFSFWLPCSGRLKCCRSFATALVVVGLEIVFLARCRQMDVEACAPSAIQR